MKMNMNLPSGDRNFRGKKSEDTTGSAMKYLNPRSQLQSSKIQPIDQQKLNQYSRPTT